MHVATKEASIDVLKFLFQMGANKNAAVSSSRLVGGEGVMGGGNGGWTDMDGHLVIQERIRMGDLNKSV